MTDPSNLPQPPIPPAVDLQDFPFFPLDVLRLRDSMLSIEATGDEFRAAILLWCVAWHQVPAASLPTSEQALAAYTGYGRDAKGWKKVRAGALRGFALHADGRLYHPVLAEKAAEAWEGKLKRRHGRECERIKKAAQRANTAPAYPTFDEWKAHVTATGSDRWQGHGGDADEVSRGTSEGHAEGHTGDVPDPVPGESHPLKGQGIGIVDRDSRKGQGEEIDEPQDSLRSSSSSAAPPTNGPPVETEALRKLRRAEEAADRLAVHTENARRAYNEIMTAPNGVLSFATEIGMDTKRSNVKRCIAVAKEISKTVYGNEAITPEFWREYFAEVTKDDFKSGRAKGGKGHGTWTPDFEFLTRKDVMVEVFEKAMSEVDA